MMQETVTWRFYHMIQEAKLVNVTTWYQKKVKKKEVKLPETETWNLQDTKMWSYYLIKEAETWSYYMIQETDAWKFLPHDTTWSYYFMIQTIENLIRYTRDRNVKFIHDADNRKVNKLPHDTRNWNVEILPHDTLDINFEINVTPRGIY